MSSSIRDAKSLKPNRREFLYYLGGAGLTVLLGQTCASLTWFAKPHVRYGVESGVFLLDLENLPKTDGQPVWLPEGNSWLVRLPNNLFLALHGQCVRDRTLVKWVSLNNRYECPHSGSKFTLDGTYIEGPARRNLDRFRVEVTTPTGTYTTLADGSPVSIADAQSIVLDTRYKILGAPRV
ncbi:MAG: hypothetical protein K8L97_04105 [Anaerolineae bacterium]|nr:hypothetical protein [Anaerolineae bacterium]